MLVSRSSTPVEEMDMVILFMVSIKLGRSGTKPSSWEYAHRGSSTLSLNN